MPRKAKESTYWAVLLGLLLLCLVPNRQIRAEDEETASADSSANFSEEQLSFFENEVVPVLRDNCLKCHAGSQPKGELDLTTRKGFLDGGESGPAVDLEDHLASNLVDAINYESWEMPPTGKMSPASIKTLTSWVADGMAWPNDLHEIEFEVEAGPPEVNEENKQFWSFQPVTNPKIPRLNEPEYKDWIRNEIDAFISDQLQRNGLQPSAKADPRELIRRAHYDLIGLPPSEELVERFAADPSQAAYEAIIDELLQSPHYGEQWGRHWLDLVRYAETNSYERDGEKPFVWRYRDYVIRSFNADKPYDQFVSEQLAGDEINPSSADAMIATGYYRLGRWDDEPADPALAYYDDIDDIVTTTGQTFLGLTINCARCHDHKIDPIPQKDYYRMVAFFRNVRRYGVRSADSVEGASIEYVDLPGDDSTFEADVAKYEKQVKANRKQINAIEAKFLDDLNDVEKQEFVHDMNRHAIAAKRVGGLLTKQQVSKYEGLLQRRRWLEANPPKSMAKALVVKEDVKSKPTYVLIRGNPGAHGEEVTPGFPSILSPPEPILPSELPPGSKTTGRRKLLAEWVCDPSNPLTARVMVNRIWQFHFGRGIVRSSSDFGFQGTAPTHPELLDWLAARFVQEGWSIKAMHKLIMSSATYQQSSRNNPDAYDIDPNNDLFWRFDMRRLTAEEIRDSILSVVGKLNKDKMFGPSIYTDIPDEVKAGQSRPGSGWGKSSPEDENRRSIYIHAKRSLPDPLLESFDMADMDLTCPVRFVTTQPTQALGMLNSDFIAKQASIFAASLREQVGEKKDEQVRLALRRVTQRPPTASEVQRGMDLMAELKSEHGLSEEDALHYFCLVALNLNEFLYLD